MVPSKQVVNHTRVKAVWRSIEVLQSEFGLSDTEMAAALGGMPASLLHEGICNQDVQVPDIIERRVSMILGIHKALQTLFPDNRQALTWIDRKNSSPLFDGKCPRTLITSGDIKQLAQVRKFLDHELI